MNASPPPPAGRTPAAPSRRRRTLPALAVGCAALILTGLAAAPAAAAAEPQARTGAQSAKTNKSARAKSAAEPAKPRTTQAAKRQPRKTSVGQAANPLPVAAMAMAPSAAQAESAARAVAFESGPGVLGVSLRTARAQQIKEYVTEPVALVALAFDDLRFAPQNKGDHVEVNLGDRIAFDPKGEKVAAKSRRVLDVIARILADNPDTRVQVQVHIDDAGDTANNLRQSQQRADAIRYYLLSKGLAVDRITALGRGSQAPLSGKRSDRFRNKRVELRIEPLTPPVAPPVTQPATSPATPPATPQPTGGPATGVPAGATAAAPAATTAPRP